LKIETKKTTDIVGEKIEKKKSKSVSEELQALKETEQNLVHDTKQMQ
jgi:hypothetical protein